MSGASDVRRPIRVTVVDDNPAMRDVFADVLAASGYDAQMSSSATADLHQLLASRPELIIINLRLDPQREELSGLQTIHAARATDELRNVPIIVCSADIGGLAAAWPDFMQRGGIHQLELPFDLWTFERLIGTALGGSTLPSEFDVPHDTDEPPGDQDVERCQAYHRSQRNGQTNGREQDAEVEHAGRLAPSASP